LILVLIDLFLNMVCLKVLVFQGVVQLIYVN